MADESIIKATYSDYRRIKTRKVHQIIFEVASETWPDIYKALGEPNIDSEEWFAIAKMHGTSSQQIKGGDVAQQAGILCADSNFRHWLAVTGDFPGIHMLDLDIAAEELRRRCDIISRAYLDHDEDAAKRFRAIKLEFEEWRGRRAA